MPETGQARVVDCHQSAAGNWGAIHRERPEPAAREVSLQDQRIMAGAKNDAVKHRVHPEDLAWRAHPPRVWLDAPRVQLFPVPPLAESSGLLVRSWLSARARKTAREARALPARLSFSPDTLD